LTEREGEWTMQARSADAWQDEYLFTLQRHEPGSFQAMCDYQQTSAEATFTRRVVCSRATAGGRVSVTHDRVIMTAGGVREESPIPDAASFQRALAEHQGIALGVGECEAIVTRFSRR
jgi:N-hydroxyarylamine O-acetyltransferase